MMLSSSDAHNLTKTCNELMCVQALTVYTAVHQFDRYLTACRRSCAATQQMLEYCIY
jgi:hypothetical protein